MYIDPNRTLRDLDPELLAEPWPGPLEPGEKTRLGKGLIWRRMDKATPIYDRKLTLAEVRHRIQAYYEPIMRPCRARSAIPCGASAPSGT